MPIERYRRTASKLMEHGAIKQCGAGKAAKRINNAHVVILLDFVLEKSFSAASCMQLSF
jgi:hypothetical protein